MRALLLLFLLMPSLVHAQVGDGVAVCCGPTTEQPDPPGRTDGFTRNLPPLDSVRFGPQSNRPEYGLRQSPPVERDAEATYPPSFGLYNLDEGGYNPGTGIHTVRPLRPWHKFEKEWATDNLPKYGNTR